MSLTEPHATVEEEGVIRLARGLGYRQRGGMRQAIAVANNECIESVTGIEAILHQNVRTLLVIPFIGCIVEARSRVPCVFLHRSLDHPFIVSLLPCLEFF